MEHFSFLLRMIDCQDINNQIFLTSIKTYYSQKQSFSKEQIQIIQLKRGRAQIVLPWTFE